MKRREKPAKPNSAQVPIPPPIEPSLLELVLGRFFWARRRSGSEPIVLRGGRAPLLQAVKSC